MMAYTIEFIAKLNDQVSGKLRGIGDAAKSSLGNLKDSFSSLGRVADGDLGGIADAIGGLVGPLGVVGAGLGTVAGVAVGAAINLQQAALGFDVLSQKTGASVEFLSGFTQAADDVRVSSETVNASLVKFSKNLADTKGAGADVEYELMALSDRFKNMADGPEKTALAMEKFGKSGADMIPILNQGGEAIRGMMQNAKDMGLVIDSSMVESSKRMAEAVDNLGDSFEGLKNKIGAVALPVLTDAVNGATNAFSTLQVQLTITDGWIKMQTGAQMTQGELVKLKGAIDLYNSSMRGSSSMTDGMVDAMIGTGKGATVMGQNMEDASLDAIRAAENTRVAIAILNGAQVLAQAKSAAAIDGTRRVLDQAYASQQKAYELQQQVNLQGVADIETKRAKTLEEKNMMDAINAANASLDAQSDALTKVGGSAGGAAAKTAELNDEMKKLEERQQAIGGFLGSNTEAMNAQQKVQTAYAIATGQLSQEQFAQEEAIKAVMQGLQDKKISEEQAVTTAMSLAQGYVTASDAMQVAGDSGKRFYDETAGVLAIAQSAKGKVEEMGAALKLLPKEQTVDVVATILGMDDLKRANEIVEKLDQHERHTIQYDVVYTVRSYGSPPPGAPPPGTDPRNASGASGGSQQGAGGRAMGGSVYAGQAVRVGELGPEVFVPAANGVISPNHQTGSGDNITINVYTSDPEAAARAVARKLKRG